jgi:hypothetical protein
MDPHTRRRLDAAVAVIDQEMNGVGEHVRELVQLQRALMGDDRTVGADDQPARAYLLMA